MLYLGHVFPGQYSFKVYNAPANLNWEFEKRLRDTVTGKLLLKGIVTSEDAQIAIAHGVDGLIVSNRGGRRKFRARR
jgi:4-hydroxymandelate oxidase